MIRHRQRQIGAAQPATGKAQRFKGMRSRHFVNQVAIDENQRGAVIKAADDMIVPNFGIKGAGLAGYHRLANAAKRHLPLARR